MCYPTEAFPSADWYNEDTPLFALSPLVRPKSCSTEPEQEPELSACASSAEDKPDLAVLGVHPPPRVRSLFSEESLEEAGSPRAMSKSTEPAQGAEAAVCIETQPSLEHRGRPSIHTLVSHPETGEQLKHTAALAMQETDRTSTGLDTPDKVDSGRVSQETVPQLKDEKQIPANGRVSPLKLELKSSSPQNIGPPPTQDSIANSPILRKNMVQIEPIAGSALPAVHQSDSPQFETSEDTSRKASLPGFQRLAELVDIASQQQSTQQSVGAPMSRAHSHSFGSTSAPSPLLPFHNPSYASSAQTSPVSYPGFSGNARSPTSTTSEGPYIYGSPQPWQPQAYCSDRRSSVAAEGGRPFAVPSLPSGSSAESHGTTGSSSTDGGYSTSHTTPIENTASAEELQRRILPPPPGMSVVPAGGFRCDYPGCQAQSFQTQYLLSSHRNVHSSSRPHYCPVKDCPRSEGGKGFKRKNEMIRHGLVHNSPGYICPFCPDRDHRYPRPDNLQRHVRVHHVDKGRDDPELREVLAQRIEGAVQKQRRRRTQGSISNPQAGAS